MDLAALARAVNVLMSPLEWGNKDVWLRESVRHVRDVCGQAGPEPRGDPRGELESLLSLPGDQAGWLSAALDDPEEDAWTPAAANDPEMVLAVLSMRCALVGGLRALHLNPGLPTTRELRVSFGLRGREPQVALLAAEGLSNAAIAERLRLSSHTVRHYLERVLGRLDLHSRKALALHLMTGNGDSAPGAVRKSRQA